METHRRLARRELGVWTQRRPVVILCHEGILWVTHTTLPGDHFLRPGQTLALPPGKCVVEALQASAFTVRSTDLREEALDGKAALISAL